MKRGIHFFLAIVIVSSALSGCARNVPRQEQTAAEQTEPEQTEARPVNVQGKAGSEEAKENGEKVRLEDDYYEFINHKLLAETEIPKDSDNWSYFYKLDRESYDVLQGVLEEAVENRKGAKQGSLEQKIGDMYLTAVDMDGRRKAGFGELQPYIDGIKNASDVKEYLKSIGKVYSDLGNGSFIMPQWSEDMMDSSRYALYLDGADLGPGKETLEDETQAAMVSRYQAYIGTVMEASGLDKEAAAQAAADILALQQDLAASALSLSSQGDPDIIFNPYPQKELNDLFPEGDIGVFLEAAGLSQAGTYVVTQKELMKKIGGYLTEEKLPLLKNYSVFVLIKDFAPFLTPEIRDDYLEWNNAQMGIKEKKTDENLAGELVQDLMGFEFGKLYVEKCFAEEDKQAVYDLVRRILDTYKKQIMALDWMGEETKEAAIKKLNAMNLKIGYPDKWPDDYREAEVLSAEAGGSLIDNAISLIKAKSRADREKVKKPVDKGEWGMTPQTVNAYYNPTGNEIVFPAAILQPPFFDAGADDAVNLGGIGMVIAHEVSHAFDSSGSLYDEKGNYHVWWTDEDRAKFKELADRVVAYYDSQDGYEGRRVNGAQTLNENIADLGALSCITLIAEEDGKDLKPLFGQYASIWASKYTPESMLRRLNTDVHSPARVRVNGVLGSTDAFYRAYPEIKEGDGMYVAPEKRVKIW